MKKMIALARKGAYKLFTIFALGSLLPLGVVVLIVWANSDENIIFPLTFGMTFVIILALFGSMGFAAMSKLKRSVQLQCNEYGDNLESEWEEPQQITKNFYKTKNWIMSTYHRFVFAAHKKGILQIEEGLEYQKNMQLFVITIIMKNQKNQRLVFADRKDFNIIMDELERWFPKSDEQINSESPLQQSSEMEVPIKRLARKEENNNRTDSIGKLIGFIVCGVILVAAFGTGYSWLMSHRSAAPSKPMTSMINDTSDAQRKDLLKSLRKETASEDDLEVGINNTENEYYGYIYNNTDYFFSGQLNLYKDNKTVGTIDCVLLKPGEYSTVYTEPFMGKADGYEFKNGEFYSLPIATTSLNYDLLYDFDEELEWYDILLSTVNTNKETITEIAKTEYYKNVVSNIVYEVLYFYDDTAQLIEEDDPNSGYEVNSAKYLTILDTETKEISLYEIVDGQEELIETLSMAN